MWYLNFNDGFIEVPFAAPSLNIYTVGCEHHCKGCHAADLQDINHENRQKLTFSIINKKLTAIPGFYKSVCWLGGDPFYQFDECYEISKQIKNKFPEIVNIVYTGYKWDEFFIEHQLNHFTPFDYVIDGTWNGKMIGQEGCNQRIWKQCGLLSSIFNFRIISFEQYKVDKYIPCPPVFHKRSN